MSESMRGFKVTKLFVGVSVTESLSEPALTENPLASIITITRPVYSNSRCAVLSHNLDKIHYFHSLLICPQHF